MTKQNTITDKVVGALELFRIEMPSWAFSDTGTRFGKFIQPYAARSIEEKFSDAGQVHLATGCCPTLALHVLWDTPPGTSTSNITKLAGKYGVKAGAINPNVFQDQTYKHGSLSNECAEAREQALQHILYSIQVAKELGSRDISLWFADGSCYPGTANIRHRKAWMTEGLQKTHAALGANMRMLVEYKPFEPAFYHTDIADWGQSYIYSKAAGPQAKVLVDTGHHYLAQNIEQIVTWLLSEDMLGGFHFNDRRYADDDLTLGSMDPYQVYRIFAEITYFEWETGKRADIAYMVDQSHNLKNKIEEMIQTVMIAQELYAKASILDFPGLAKAQQEQRLIDAETIFRDAFNTDVRPAIREWRRAHKVPEDPIGGFRTSGYMERLAVERAGRDVSGGSYA
jgi:L-rhamnose isomerase / sugar isomerase